MSFSEDMERIQEILEEISSDEVSMERSLELFEEGVGLIKQCRDYLADAKRKITLLTDEGEQAWGQGDKTTEGDNRDGERKVGL